MGAYNISTGADGTQILFVTDDARPFSIDESHPNFSRIREALLRDDFELAAELADSTKRILAELGEDVRIDGDVLYYKGEALYSKLAQTIVEFCRAGLPFTRLLRFLQKVMKNPSRHSREQLYEFLNRNAFTITEEGDFLAFKGVNAELCSLTAGPGTVNGEEMNGHLPNFPGNVIQMNRKDVIDDPRQACSFGLHVGDFSYASGFGERLVEVLVNPEHVVSVPNDSGYRKVRTCEYRVLREVERTSSERSESAAYQAESDFTQWLRRFAAPYGSNSTLAGSVSALAQRYIENAGDTISAEHRTAVLSMAARLDARLTEALTKGVLEALLNGEEPDDDWSVEDEWDEYEEEYEDDYEDDQEESEFNGEESVQEFLEWLRSERDGYTRKGRMADSYFDLAERFFDEYVGELDEDAVREYVYNLDESHRAEKVYAYHVDAVLADEGLI